MVKGHGQLKENALIQDEMTKQRSNKKYPDILDGVLPMGGATSSVLIGKEIKIFSTKPTNFT